MIASNVLGNWHLMSGIDPHNFWPPGSPSPSGFAPHGCNMVLNGFGITASKSLRTKATNNDIIHQGSDIGNFIPHYQANLLLPLIIAFSGSKSQFGVNSVKVENKPVGVACAKFVNINMNCAEPVYVPFGVVVAMPMTCQAGFTLADFLAGMASMAFDTALSGVMFLLGKGAGDVFGKLFNKVTAPLLRNTIRPVLLSRGMVSSSLLLGAVAKEFPSAFFFNIVIGTPLGWSPETSIYNQLGVDDISDRNIREPVYNYFSDDNSETLSSNNP